MSQAKVMPDKYHGVIDTLRASSRPLRSGIAETNRLLHQMEGETINPDVKKRIRELRRKLNAAMRDFNIGAEKIL